MKRLAALALFGVFSAGCADQPTGLGDVADLPGPAERAVLETTTCETVDFEEFAHGEEVTQVSVLGMMLGIGVVTYDNGGVNTTARAFWTDGESTPTIMEDGDLQWRGPDFWDPNGGIWKEGDRCPGCEPLGKVLVIEDPRGFLPWGDHAYGGELIFSGLPMGGPDTYYVNALTVVDDEEEEPPFRLVVEGDTVATSNNAGDGQVTHVVVPDAALHPVLSGSFKVVLGTVPNDHKTGSGAVDNLEICRVREEFVPGDEGCTLGFWKNHLSTWVGYDPDATLESVFDVPDYLGMDDATLLEALGFGGGAGAVGGARILFKQAVAALLNAAHPDVAYEWSVAQVISAVNTALTGSRSDMTSLAAELDDYNNRECTASGANTTGNGP